MHQLFITGDGSHSVIQTDLNVSFHSKHGAVSESGHIYINAGLNHVAMFTTEISILELGFGSGLNCLLTFIRAEEQKLRVAYETFEKYPLHPTCASSLNFTSTLGRQDLQGVFAQMHSCPWDECSNIGKHFTLHKRPADITTATIKSTFNLVYWDAFDPITQPELWNFEQFSRVRTHMNPGGILVTYSSKSTVRRALRAAGFEVEKIPGPHGKREITRATAI